MQSILREHSSLASPDALMGSVHAQPGMVCLRSGQMERHQARYSLVVADPFLTFRSKGSHCSLRHDRSSWDQFGNPWQVLDTLMARYELLEEPDLPFPMGGCFGFWGYELRHFVEARRTRHAFDDLALPDCVVGFYSSLVVFDHWLGKTWIVATGMNADGTRSNRKGQQELDQWERRLDNATEKMAEWDRINLEMREKAFRQETGAAALPITCTLSREEYLQGVRRILEYIRQGDIYQANLARRWMVPEPVSGRALHQALFDVSPAPYSGYLDAGDFQVVSSSPELFLRMNGPMVRTRPIKGTRPRNMDSAMDARLTYDLQTSPKEMAELVMITDLLRNDLGRVCDYGSVTVPELVRLERYPQVQHLVSTVEGRLRPDVTHLAALASCFPGGSITGAPKIRATDIIDELEPVTRGPYTGCMGYLGFNRESQLNILIRTAINLPQGVCYFAGSGIVADSQPEAEHDETLAKASGFFQSMQRLGLRSFHPEELIS